MNIFWVDSLGIDEKYFSNSHANFHPTPSVNRKHTDITIQNTVVFYTYYLNVNFRFVSVLYYEDSSKFLC